MGGESRSAGRSIGSAFGKAFAVGGALVAAAGIGAFFKTGLESLARIEVINTQTETAIKSTGAAAGVSAGHIEALAGKLENLTATEAESTQEGANLLLTFTNIRNEAGKGNKVFDQATSTLVDMARALGTDPQTSAVQLGKALNDPIKGVTALQKIGVSFTQSQKDTIKSLVDSGDTMKAQKLILGELNKEFGGSGAAYGKTTQGQVELAKHAFGTLQETILSGLLPPLGKLATAAASSLNGLAENWGPIIGQAKAVLAPFIAQVQGFFGGSGGGGFIAGVQSVAATLQATFIPVLKQAAATFTTVIVPAVTSFVSYVASALLPVFQQIVGIVVNNVLPIYRSLAVFFYSVLAPAVFQIAAAIGQRLKPIFDQLVATFQGSVLPAFQQILAAFQRNLPTIQKVATVVLKVAGFFLKLAASILGKVIPVLIRLAGFIIGKVVPVLVSIVSAAIKVVGALIRFGSAVSNAAQVTAAFAKKVGTKIKEVVTFFVQLPAKIRGALSGAGNLLLTIGGQIIEGLKRGITNAGSKVATAVRAIIDKIPKAIRKIMGIASPSKVTTILGGYIGDGLAKGITSSEKKITKAIGKTLDAAKDKLSSRIDDFKSLADSVGSNFAGSLFSGFETAGDFLGNLTTVRGNLSGLLTAFTTLRGFGLPGSFLAQLFADGGAPLILELAKNQGQATAAASLFSDIQSLSGSLGASVAQNTPDIGGGATLADLNATLKEANKLLAKVPDGVGKSVGGAAAKGARNKKKGGKK